MATTHPVQISIGATLAASLGASVRGAQAQMNQLGSTMAQLGNKQSGVKQLDGLRNQAKDAALVMRAAQQKVKGQESAIAGQEGGPTAKQSKALERAQAQAAKAEELYLRQRVAVDTLTASLNKAGLNTRALGVESARLGSQMEILRTRTDALSRAQQAQAVNMEKRSSYRAQMMDAVALGGALYGLVKPAVAFESVMADVKKVVDFETPDHFAKMSKDVLLMSTRIPMAADGIGAIVAAAGQAGIAREELLRFAEDAAKMGVAFDLSGSQAGAAMTGLRSIFGLTQDQVVSMGDAINHLSNNMDAKAGDLLDIANRAGSTAKLFGLSGAQLNALGASFLALKTKPEVAATGINALMMKLATADKQNEKFQKGLEDIGLSAAVVKKMIGRDAQGALVTFLEQVKKAPDVMGTLSDLFGMEYADDVAKLVGSLDTYKKAVGLVADKTAYAGSMQKEYEARSATTANNIQLLGNQMSRMAVTVGSALLPALNGIVGAAAGPINMLVALAERFPIVTQLVVGGAVAMMAWKIATIGMGYAWTFVKGPLLGAQVAIQSARAHLALLRLQTLATAGSTGMLAAAWTRIQTGALGIIAPIKAAALSFWAMLPAIGATTAALLANPITWIVVGIGAAVAGLALVIRKYWDPLAAFVGGVFGGIRDALVPTINSITTALQPLAPVGSAIAAVFGWIADAVGGVVGWIGALFAPVTLTKDEFDSLSNAGHSLGTVIGTVLGAAFTLLTLPIRTVGTLIGWVFDAFQALAAFSPLALIAGGWQPVADFFTNLWSGITATVGKAIDWIADKIGWVLNAGAKVGDWFGSVFGGDAKATNAKPAAKPAAIGATVAPRSPVFAHQGAPAPSTQAIGNASSVGVPGARAAAAPVVGATASTTPAVGSSMPKSAPSLAQTSVPAPGAAKATSNSASSSVSINAPITVNVPGMSAQEIATLIQKSLRELMADAQRRPAAAMYD
jgi:TP901 family phage tail tape measure protein